MNPIEEIKRKYDRRRAVLHFLRYAEQIFLPLVFYSYFRFSSYNSSLFKFCFTCGFLAVMAKQFCLFLLYGIGSTRTGTELPAVRWGIVLMGALGGVLLLEVLSYFVSGRLATMTWNL
jgi:hypothetical protein